MAFFKPAEGKGPVFCYEGTVASAGKPAELKNEFFIAKARQNPDFVEVVPVAPIKKVAKKKVAKKKVTKKVSKK